MFSEGNINVLAFVVLFNVVLDKLLVKLCSWSEQITFSEGDRVLSRIQNLHMEILGSQGRSLIEA